MVAGVSAAPGSLAALRFAFEEAALRPAPLLAVCALADGPAARGGEHQLQEDAESLLDDLEKEHPGVAVERRLPRPGRSARLGGVRGMRLGSVGQGALQDAPCPVAIVGLP